MNLRLCWQLWLLFGFGALAPVHAQTASTAASAATQFDLGQLVRTVLLHNPTLQAAQLGRVQASASISSAAAWANPRIEFSDGRLRPNTPAGNSGSVNVWGVSQLIENPALRSARIQAAEQGLRGQEALVAMVRSEVVAQVRLRAYELLLRIEEARAAGEELELLEQTRERVRVRVDSGEAPRYEIIKAEAEFIRARQRQQSAQLAVEQVRLQLNQLAAGKLPARWNLSNRLDEPVTLRSGAELRSQLLASNPELRELRAELERQQARVRQADASRWPGVELRYAETREPDNRQSLVGASIQIPLLDQRRGPRAEAAADLLRAQTRLEGQQTTLQLRLDSALMALEMARLRVDALGTGAIRDAEAALRVAQAAYRYGERGILDVLDAQRVLQSVRSDLLDARYQLQAARIELELLTGRYADEPS